MKKQALTILCPSALAAAFVANYLTAEGHLAVWLIADTSRVFAVAPVDTVNAACDAADAALRLSAQRGGN